MRQSTINHATVSIIQCFSNWAVDSVGSSRSSALIRIGLVLIIWARFASDQIPFKHEFGWHTLFSIAFFLSTTMMLIGIFTRFATFVTGIIALSFYYYFGLVLDVEPYTHHHTYWLGVAAFLCSLTPCGRSFSLDRWLAVKKARQKNLTPPPERGNLWGLRLIVVQLTAMYFWSAFAKTNAGFLGGDRLEAIFMQYYIGSNLADWAAWSWAFVAAAWGITILEYLLAFGMPFARTRKYLLIPGLALHAGFYLLLPVRTYSVTIMLLYLAYLDADKVHRFLDEIAGRETAPIREP
ncbi:MAG: HTTM domain-containing protein [Methylococcales bacterium]